MRDVSHPSWCGNCVTQDLLARNTGFAVFHSSNSTMTRTFGQVLLQGASGQACLSSILSVAVTPHVYARRQRWPQPPSGTWGETETTRAHWNWDEHQTQETTPKHESWTEVRTKLVSRNSHLNLESQVCAVTNATPVSRMITSRPTLTPLFDLSRHQRGGPLF